MSRSATRSSWTSVAALLLAAFPAASGRAQPVPSEPDQWSAPITWTTDDGWFASAIHSTLLPDGRILFIGYERDQADAALATQQRKSAFVMLPHALGQALPAAEVIQHITEPVDADGQLFGQYLVFDDLFCSGHTLTADGTFFSAGGTRYIIDAFTNQLLVTGLPYATVSDGNQWLRVPSPMTIAASLDDPARWYPTCTRLPDRRIMVTSGLDLVHPIALVNKSVEAFDPATGQWQVVSPFGAPPDEIVNPDYTHPVVLPAPVGPFDVLMFGGAGVPVLMTSQGIASWLKVPVPRPGSEPGQTPNAGASTAPLPIRIHDGEWGYLNGSVLIAGGEHDTAHITAVDVFDPRQAAWAPKLDTQVARHHPTAVVLPTGQVLLVGGDNTIGDTSVRRNGYVDPRHGFKLSLGLDASQEARGYHHVALLLPDGRVLVGGGRDAVTGEDSERVTFRYYSPAYLSKPRPRITAAPAAIAYGQPLFIGSQGKRPGEVVLMSLGSMTHSFDANQRYVQLAMPNIVNTAAGDYQITAVAPASPQVAPPGWYMLFVLDRDLVPSKATLVKLG